MSRTAKLAGLAMAISRIGLAQSSPPTITLTLPEAQARAQANSQQLLSADLAARIAHEDKVQAKAALLPTAEWFNGFVYTQPNGSDTGTFVANNGPRVYTNWAQIHADYSPTKRADYRIAIAAESVARARFEIAQRGIAA